MGGAVGGLTCRTPPPLPVARSPMAWRSLGQRFHSAPGTFLAFSPCLVREAQLTPSPRSWSSVAFDLK